MSTTESIVAKARFIDDKTAIFYLRLSGAKVVLFQAIIETYEGLGTVRTVNIKDSLVSVITTPDQVADCQMLFSSLQPSIPWRCAADEMADHQDIAPGYAKKAKKDDLCCE